jgi:hypothetical protein
MPGTGFCTVFAEDPDHDGPTQLRDLMNLNGVYDAFGAQPLINPLSLGVLNAYTDYHELGHCLHYVPPFPAGANQDQAHLQRHKGEVFGDIFAALMLARDGVTDFAPRYARVRLVASAMAGIDDEYDHATWDGLEAAQRVIDARGTGGLKKMTITDIAGLARRMTEETAISMKTERFVAAFQASNYDRKTLLTEISKDKELEQSFYYALRLKERMSFALLTSVDLRGLGPAKLAPLDLVQYYRTHQQEEADETTGTKGSKWQDIVARLRNELLAEAGSNPDAASLSKAFTVKKDALRHMLEGGDAAKQSQAAQDLPFMERALRQAVAVITP